MAQTTQYSSAVLPEIPLLAHTRRDVDKALWYILGLFPHYIFAHYLNKLAFEKKKKKKGNNYHGVKRLDPGQSVLIWPIPVCN